MSAYRSVLASRPPSRWLCDFDLVTTGGRLRLVGTANENHQVCSWDPLLDEWTEHRLENAALEEGADFSEITSLGAAVLDDRIVVGGGGDYQGFSTWDLETGAVRLYEQPDVVGSIGTVELGDRVLFLAGSADGFGATLWDPSVVEPDDETPDAPDVEDFALEVDDVVSRSPAGSGIAVGVWEGRAVLLAGDEGGDVIVRDFDGEVLTGFEPFPGEVDDPGPTDFAFGSPGGRPWVVAAGGRQLAIGDPATGSWGETLEVPGGEVSCLDVRTPHDRTFAVTGGEDGTVGVWDLAERRLLLPPLQEHDGALSAVRIAELDGQPVVVSSAQDCTVRVWELPF